MKTFMTWAALTPCSPWSRCPPASRWPAWPSTAQRTRPFYATQILGATLPEYRQKMVNFKQQMAEA